MSSLSLDQVESTNSSKIKRIKLFWLTAATLWQREIVRFYRQPSRIIGALGVPVLFWILIGSGLGDSFRPVTSGVETGGNFLQYFFPGSLLLIVMFTSIFSSYSLIEDRNQGFLQAVLVSPASRGSIALGKILGGTTLAVLQAMLFLCLAPLIGIPIQPATGFVLAAVIFFIAMALTSIGFILAWPLESSQGFHSLVNLVLIPIWILSGALFPASGAFGWVRVLMNLNPLKYSLDLLRYIMSPAQAPTDISITLCVIVTVAFALTTYAVSWIIICRPQTQTR